MQLPRCRGNHMARLLRSGLKPARFVRGSLESGGGSFALRA